MSPERRLELDCGIAYARIAGWLDHELALPREGEAWQFGESGSCCSISAEAQDDRMFARVGIPRTRLVAEGDAEAVDAFQRAFTLRFMSAGG